MKIEHIAIWVSDLEMMKNFYVKIFDLRCNEKYYNPKKNFSSYFLSFENGFRIELMHKPNIAKLNADSNINLGYAHIALSIGSKDAVDQFTIQCRENGIHVESNPRTTGDGYYESVITDPEGNLIEITV